MDLEGLSFVCNGLGFERDGVYHLHEFCLENIKDLQRFLRRDNPQTRDVFKQVCRFNTVAVDLVPIIEQHNDDRDLLITAVKVLVFMTMPIDPTSDDIVQQLEYLWNLKASLTRNDAVAAIALLLEEPLEHLDSDAFTEDDFNLVQLVLTLFRNLLAVQDLSLQQKASGTSMRLLCLAERFLELLFIENVMELILVLTQHLSGPDGYLYHDNLLLMDIFHYIFLGHEPGLITNPSQKEFMGDENAVTSLSSLRAIMEEEDERRRVMRLQYGESSHFAGTFVRYNVDGSRTLLKGKLSSVPTDSLLKKHKVQRGPLKRIMWDNESLNIPNRNILGLLHGFAEQFLSGGYNVLMQSIRDDIEKDHHTIQNSEVTRFFEVARFFTAYQRYRFPLSKVDAGAPEASSMDHSTNAGLFHGSVCGPIAETMNEAMFNLVLSKWRYAFDSVKETHDYKFLSSSGSLMKEMICLLDLVLKMFGKGSAGEAYTARVLLHKIFYDQTEEGITHFLFNLMKSFDSHKQPRSDLADLLEMAHIILRLMESLQSHGVLRVSKRSKKRSKRKLGGDQSKQVKELDEHMQIDAAAEENCDAVHSTPNKLADGVNPQKGASLNFNSGCNNDVGISKLELPLNNALCESSTGIGTKDGSCEYKKECGNESFNDDEQAAVVEVDLDTSRIASMFANSTVVQNLCWLLRFYKSNHANTNYYIICMLQRITDDLELSPMLFQLSVLCIFYEILLGQKRSTNKGCEHIVSFITNLVGKLMNKLKSHPLLFVDILLWKTNRDCHYMNSGFLLHEISGLRSKTRTWLENSVGIEGGEADKTRFRISIADALGEDEADLVPSHKLDDQIDENEESLQSGSDKVRSEVGLSNIRTSFSAQGGEVDADLFYKGRRSCALLISKTLSPDGKISATQISRKLKQLGLMVSQKEKNVGILDGGKHDPLCGENEDGSTSKNMTGLVEVSHTNITLHARKRVRAFSKEQEIMIKKLFEKFKTQKRCSYLIANALDSNKMYSAAQVSRKLKQLGLHRSQSDMMGIDMESGEIVANSVSSERTESDDETLSTHKKSSDGSSDEQMDRAKGFDDSLKEADSGSAGQANKKKRVLLYKSLEVPHQDLSLADEITNLEDGVEDTPKDVTRKRHKVVFDFEDDE